MIRAHKIRLNQANCLAHAAGTSRFVFNRGPAQWKRQYEAGATLSAPALKKQFDALRAQAYLWTSEVTRCAVGGGFMDLGKAFQHFFDGRRFENQKPLRVGLRLTVITTPVSIWNKRLVCWPRLGKTANRFRYWLGRDAKGPVKCRHCTMNIGAVICTR